MKETSGSHSARLVLNAVAGAVAGTVGTAAMDLLLYSRSRNAGNKDSLWAWEFAEGITSWKETSAPGQLGEKLERFVTGQQPPDSWARSTTNLIHWATGIGWALQYGALATKTSRHPITRAVALGPEVWLAGYVILPLAKVYKPIWRYDGRTLGDDLSAHLAYGAVTSAVFETLTRRRP